MTRDDKRLKLRGLAHTQAQRTAGVTITIIATTTITISSTSTVTSPCLAQPSALPAD